MYDETF
jgi:hypothetical protein